MNNARTYLLLAGLCLVGVLAGCIKEDFSDCPSPVPPVSEDEGGWLDLNLSYTMHNRMEDGGYADRFAEEIKKVDVFVFDQEGSFVTGESREVERTGGKEPYSHAVRLPEGDYQVVVWGNRNEAEAACLVGPGSTIETALLSFGDEKRRGLVRLLSDSLFHGMTEKPFPVVAGERRSVSVELMKNRKDIRLLVRRREKGADKDSFCADSSHFDNLNALIIDDNGTYDFSNRPKSGDSIAYVGGDFPNAERYDAAFHPEGKLPFAERTFKRDFSVQRLMVDNRPTLNLYRGTSRVYSYPLLRLIQRVKEYATQEDLDREDRFLIELLFECDHPEEPEEPEEPKDPEDPEDPEEPRPERPWRLISVSVNGWNFIEKDIEL